MMNCQFSLDLYTKILTDLTNKYLITSYKYICKKMHFQQISYVLFASRHSICISYLHFLKKIQCDSEQQRKKTHTKTYVFLFHRLQNILVDVPS